MDLFPGDAVFTSRTHEEGGQMRSKEAVLYYIKPCIPDQTEVLHLGFCLITFLTKAIFHQSPWDHRVSLHQTAGWQLTQCLPQFREAFGNDSALQ